jgi:hypothetical protein
MGILDDAYHGFLNRLKTDQLHYVSELALGKHNGMSSIIIKFSPRGLCNH